MGWWETRSGALVGDGPLDALGDAVRAVLADYARGFRRKPTREEWQSLLFLALCQRDEEDLRPLAGHVITRVTLEVEPLPEPAEE